MSNVLLHPTFKTKSSTVNLPARLSSLNAECRNCTPITPFECISHCRVYQRKSELKHLWEAMDNPHYIQELFNTLKNQPRLHVMQAIENGSYSLGELQECLSKFGYSYPQQYLSEECLRPLMVVGLAANLRDRYRATTLGDRLTKLLRDKKFADKLPAHSECYEEALLQSFLSGPKTFEEIKADVAPKNMSRTLNRLRSRGLIKTPKARAYIFFFKTIRDPAKETLAATQRRIYDAVADTGISAAELATQTGLSLRGTYKCLRHLRGKKLVFTRRTPKTYALTVRGTRLALLLVKIEQAVWDILDSSQDVMWDNQSILEAGGLPNNVLLH